MSAHKKKRIGSRRRVVNQNETSEADELHQTDSLTIPQHCTPEENKEPLNVLANPHGSLSETPNPPLPELSKSRRKLGSSRKSKEREHVKDSTTKSYNKPTEEVEENIKGNETPETTQISLSIQPQRQEELGQGSEHGIMSATHGSSLYSAIAPDNSIEVQCSTRQNFPEDDMDGLNPKSEYLQANQDENDTDSIVASEATVLERNDRCDTLQSEELIDNASSAGLSELPVLNVTSCPTVDKQPVDQLNSKEILEEVLTNVYSVTKNESKQSDRDAELLQQDGNLHDNYLVSDSHEKLVDTPFPTTPKKTTDKSSPREKTEAEDSIEQEVISSTNKKLPKEEKQNEPYNLSKGQGPQNLKDAINTIQEQEVKQVEIIKNTTKHSEIEALEETGKPGTSQNKVRGTPHSENAEKRLPEQEFKTTQEIHRSSETAHSTDGFTTKQGELNPDDKSDMHTTKRNNLEALEQKNEDYHVEDDNETETDSSVEVSDKSVGASLEGIDKADTPQGQEVRDTHQSEDAANKEHEQEFETRQRINHSSFENASHDSTENSKMISGNLIDEAEGSVTYQSGLSVKSSDDCAAKPEDSNRDDKSGMHPTEGKHLEASEQTNEDYHVNEDKKQGISDTETVETGQEHKIKGQIDNELKPSAELTHHQEQEEIFSESQSSLQTLNSEMNVPLDSQSPDSSVTAEEQTPTGFNPIENRRKLGSTRRNKGRQHAKDSYAESYHENTEEVLDNNRDGKALETEQMMVAIERTNQEELSQDSEHDTVVSVTHDSSLSPATMPDYSSEVQSMTTSDYPKTDPDSWIQKSESLPEDDNETETDFNVEVSDKSVGASLEGMDKTDTSQGQEVRDTHQLEDAANKEFQTGQEINHSFEIVSHDSTENSEMISGNLIDEAEVCDAYQSELAVKSSDDFIAKQDDSNCHDKSDVQTGLFSEMEKKDSSLQTLQSDIQSHLDYKPQHEDTNFKPIGNRRKLGSSRRNKGRQHAKDSYAESYHENTEEVLDNNRDGKALETEQMMVAIERTNQEELSQDSEHDTVVSVTLDSSLSPATMPDYSPEVQSMTTSDYPKTDPDSWIQKSESLPEDDNETETDFNVEVSDKSVGASLEGMDKTDTSQGQEVRDTHQSEDAANKEHEQEFETRQRINHSSFENVSHDSTENSKMISGNLIDEADGSVTYQSGLSVKSSDDCAAKPEDSNRDDKSGMHPTEGKHLEASEQTNEDYHVNEDKKQGISDTETVETGQEHKIKGQIDNELKPSAELTHHQEQEEIFSESQSSLQTLNSEMNVPLDSQSPDSSVTAEEQTPTGFNPIENRRKLGSTRRNKGRQHAKDSYAESYHENTEEVLDNNRDGKALETEQMMVAIERTNREELSQDSEHDTVVSVTHDSSLSPATMPDYSSEVQSMTTSDYPKTDPDSWIQKSESLPEDDNETETDFNVEVSDKSVGASLEGMDKTDTSQGQEVRDTHQLEDAANKEFQTGQEIDHSFEIVSHDSTENSEMISGNLIDEAEVCDAYQSELAVKSSDDFIAKQDDSNCHDKSDVQTGLFSEMEKKDSSLQTLQSDIQSHLDYKPQHEDTNFKPIGNRRKLGSSRRNKGRQHAKDSYAESYHENTEEVLDNNRDGKALETEQMMVAIERTNQEELSQDSEHDTVVSVTLDSSLSPATMPDYSPEVQSMTTSDYPKTDPDSWIQKSESLPEDDNETETDFNVEVSDKSVGASLEGMDKTDTSQGQEVRDTHQSEDAANKEHEQEFETRQRINHSSFENVSHDSTENSKMISGNLIDEADGSVTYQSGLSVKSSDDCAAKPEDSNRDDKSGMHPTEGKHLEASEQTNEDYHVNEDKKQGISDTETVETGQEHKIKGQIDNELKPSAELTHHQEQEEIFSESQSSLQTLNSEMNVPLDSQSPDSSVTAEEQTPTGFNPIENRRKLGSTRRNKGRQHAKDSYAESYHENTEEVLDNNRDGKALETEQMMVAIERTNQEELSQDSEHDTVVSVTHDSSLSPATMPDYSPEVQSMTTSDYPKTDPDSWIQKSESLPEDDNETETDFNVEVSDKSVGASLEGMDKTDTSQGQEVRDTHQLEDAANKEFQTGQEIDHSFEIVSHDSTENSEMISGNLIDEAEVCDAYQSELAVKSSDDFIAKQDDSNCHDKSDVQTGLFSEMEKKDSSLQTLQSDIQSHLDYKPQHEDTNFKPIGNRRKLGSSRRNKGRQHAKDSYAESYHENTEEVLDNNRDGKALETEQMMVAIERTNQEELSQDSEHDTVVSVTLDSSLSPATMPDYSPEVQSMTTSDYPKTDPDSWIQKSESLPEDDNETETDFNVEVSDKSVGASLEGMDKTDTSQGQEVRDTHQLEDAANKEFQTGQEIDHSFEIVSHDSTENSEMISGNLIDEAEVCDAYQSELAVKSSDDFIAKQDDSNCHDKSDVQTGLFSEMEKKDSSLQTLQSDLQSHLDYKSQHEDTNFKPIGNRRKLGSSRRNKGRQHAKDSYAESSYENKEEESGDTRNSTPETAVQVQEKTIETMEGIDTFEITHMGEVNDQVIENAHVDTHVDTPVGTFKLSTSSIHSNLTVDQELIDQSHSTEMPEDELLHFNSVIEKESNNEKDETELLRQDGNSQDNFSVSDSHLKLENKEYSHTQEVFREKHSYEEHMEPECSVEQAIVSSPKEELTTNEEQNVNAYISQLKESLHLDDVANEMHEEVVEPTQMQEMHQVHFSSVMASESSEQTLQESEEQTRTGFNSVGNRRKLGSSRRHKGRQLVKECVTDPFHKPKEELVENTRGGDVFEQKDACHIQKTEALFCEKDSVVQEINMQLTNDATEAVGNVTVKEINTEVKSSMSVQVFGQNKVGEEFEDPIKKDSEAQVISASQEMMHAELFLATHNTADALAQFDLKEKSQVQLEAYFLEESGISAAVGADSQQGIQEKTLESNSENMEKSKQRRRKMGSTCRTQLNREPEDERNKDNENEGDFNMEAGINFHKIEVTEAVADIKDGEQSVDINMETSKLGDFTGTGIHITSELTERNATNTDVTRGKFLSSFKATQRTQNDEERLESVNVIQAQALKSAEASVVAVADLEIVKPVFGGGASEEHSDTQLSIQDPNNLNEGALTESLEMKNTSPNLNSARRRKMGSTRKSLSSRSKREDFHQKQVEDNEAIGAIINVGDVKTESFPGIKEKEELQLHMETKEIDPEQRQEKLIETVEYSNTGESHLKHPSNQTFEEKPVSPGNLMETEHLLNPNYFPVVPSTSPSHDIMSETAGGRRRKLGSSRKSRGLQSNENQTARKDRITDMQNERDVRSVIDESAIKTTTEESLGLAKISEVDENDQKPSSNISTEHPRPVSEKTAVQANPVQQPRAETRPSQESQKTFSLSSSTGADRSNAYNVLMVGDSSVGKTSFIKRAQSGKFSLDLPASVGIDSCLWTVVVEGKPVVLKLWDTAGQERFHSITRQIFHKAQAFLLMYDITSSQSFAAVRYWLNCIQEGAAENVTIVLLGNKSDHAGRQVQSQEGKNLAKDYGFKFMECSAATGENVINSLETVARMLSQRPDTREETSVLHKEPQQKKSSGCC